MVAVADVIKKMQSEGMTREQIIDSLTELGFPNAEALYEKNVGTAGQRATAAPKPPAAPKPGGLLEAAEREEEKPLFEQPAPKKEEAEEKEEKQEKGEAQETEEAEGPPELKITQISEEGLEKTVSIEDMLSKEGATATTAAGAGGAPLASDSSLRAKLEETNALLKALADVNKKILETDREVLMRLKAKETQNAQASQASKT
jgi:hypothetical protein